MPDIESAQTSNAFALELRRMLDELGLDIDIHGAVIKTQNTRANLGIRSDMVLGQALYRRLATLWPRGVSGTAEEQDAAQVARSRETTRDVRRIQAKHGDSWQDPSHLAAEKGLKLWNGASTDRSSVTTRPSAAIFPTTEVFVCSPALSRVPSCCA